MTDTQLDKLSYVVDAELGPYQAKMKQVDETADQTGKKLGEHFKRAGEGAEKLGDGIELSRRELLYFGRELATGDIQRLPSTMVLLGSHLAGLTSEAILMGGAVLAPFAALGLAAYQAEAAQQRIRTAIAATGDAAGVTESQVASMTLKASQGTDLSRRGASDIMAKLIGTGNISGDALVPATEATSAYSKMSGLNLDKSADKMGELLSDPAKAAKELHDQFHLLTDAEMLRIEGMKSIDEQQKAISEAMIKRGGQVTDSMWSLSKGFDSFGTWLADKWYNTGAYLDPNRAESNGDKITRLNSQINNGAGTAGGKHPYTAAQLNKMRAELMDATRKQAMEGMHADEGKWQAESDRKAAEARSPGALEIKKYQDAARVAASAPRDREMMRARLEAQRQYTANSANPDMAKYAGGIEHAAINAAQVEQNSARKEAITLANQTAEAEEKLAAAYRISTAEGEALSATNKAHAAYLKGSIDDEKAYAAALLRTAAAERQVNANKADLKLASDTQALRLENSLSGDTEDSRNKKIADLKAHNAVQDEGFDLTTDAGQAELAMRLKITDAMQDQLKIQRDLKDAQNQAMDVAKDGESLLGDIFDHANKGAAGLRTLLPDLTSSLLSMIEKLTILNPLENAITGNVTGTPGKLPTMANVSKLLGLGGGGGDSAGGGDNGVIQSAGSSLAKAMGTGASAKAASGSSSMIGRFVDNLFGSSHAQKAMASGPNGTMGTAADANQAPVVHQYLSVHPDVSSIAKGEIVKAMPGIQASAVQAFGQAIGRGFVPGNIAP